MKKILTITALGVVLASNASASGFHLKEQSVSNLGNAFAGATAGGDDISSSYFNPASLTRYKGSQIVVGGTYVAPSSKTKYATANVPGLGVSETGNSGDIVQDAVLPNFYASKELSNGMTIGMSFNAPFGLITKYDDKWAGRMHGTLSDVKTYTFTPMIGYKLDEKMSLGIGAQVQHVKARLRNGVNVAGRAESKAKLEGDTTDVGFVLGAMYEWREDTRFGIGYRSKIHHKLKGDLNIERIAGVYPGAQGMDINAELTTPAILSLGIYHDINEKWAVMGEFQRTYWSDFDELTIKNNTGLVSTTEEKWKNTNFYSIGANYKIDDKWKLRFGLGFDKSAVKKEYRTPRIPDSDRKWYSLGAQYKHSEALAFDVGYTYIKAANTGKVVLDGTSPGDVAGGRGSIYADYKSYVHIIGIGATYSF